MLCSIVLSLENTVSGMLTWPDADARMSLTETWYRFVTVCVKAFSSMKALSSARSSAALFADFFSALLKSVQIVLWSRLRISAMPLNDTFYVILR